MNVFICWFTSIWTYLQTTLNKSYWRWTFIVTYQTQSQPWVQSLSVDKLLSSHDAVVLEQAVCSSTFFTHSSPYWRATSFFFLLKGHFFTLSAGWLSSPPRYGAGVSFSEKLPFFPRWSFPLGLLCTSHCIIIVCISCIYWCLQGSMSKLFLNKVHSMC